MRPQSVKLDLFSSTGTTGAIIKGVVRGINTGPVELIDITKPAGRMEKLQTYCVCMKKFPQKAKSMNAAIRVSTRFKERKEPALVL